MATRTLFMHGITHGDTAAIIKLNGNVIHSGPVNAGVLFSFMTDVTKHGKVLLSIDMLYGAMTISHVRVTYPAMINSQSGYINMPQPISQPLTSIDDQSLQLPLTIDSSIQYNHYMVNGPLQWTVTDNVNSRFFSIDDFYNIIESDKIYPDWGYDNKLVDIKMLYDLSLIK